jgi:hypothetical protein
VESVLKQGENICGMETPILAVGVPLALGWDGPERREVVTRQSRSQDGWKTGASGRTSLESGEMLDSSGGGTGQPVHPLDLSDDRLAGVLEVLSQDEQ